MEKPENQPIMDPKHELPQPHDMELPIPHDMQLKPHLTHRYSWLHWLPAVLGLFIGISVGYYLLKDADLNRGQLNKPAVQPTTVPASGTNQILPDAWQTYTNPAFGYRIEYPPDWKYTVLTDTQDCCSTVIFSPLTGSTSVLSENQQIPTDQAGLISIDINRSNQTLNQAVNEYCLMISCNEKDLVPVTVNGIPGKQFNTNASQHTIITMLQKNTAGNKSYTGTIVTMALFNKIGDEYFSFLSATDRAVSYQRMVSSFAFIDSAPIVSQKPSPFTTNGPDQVFCAQDAKQCPDGSFVGRIGPNCEFAPCTIQQP